MQVRDISMSKVLLQMEIINNKKSYGFKKDDFSVCYDGSLLLNSINGEMPLSVNSFYLDDGTNSRYLNGHVKKLAYYPQRLTNEQLQKSNKMIYYLKTANREELYAALVSAGAAREIENENGEKVYAFVEGAEFDEIGVIVAPLKKFVRDESGEIVFKTREELVAEATEEVFMD